MARLGSTKVRTGCFTCKTRRVKCDETKPSCRRCTTTHRTCPGYPEVTGQAQYSWAHLLANSGTTSSTAIMPCLLARPPPMSVADDDATMDVSRALAFFRAQVAPALSRHSSKRFWTVVVAQIAREEPSVRHALAAISGLYEGRLQEGTAGRLGFAMTHYNKALGCLRQPATDKNIVLLACLLFICIEAIQGDKGTAIQHCRHGILICNDMPAGLSGWAKDELQPIFLRLATFPYFFGTEAGEFPEPSGLVPSTLDSEGEFDTSSAAWDALINRTVRVIRRRPSHRQSRPPASPVPQVLAHEQFSTLRSLIAWRRHLQRQRRSHAVPDEDFESHTFREMQCITGQVWLACCTSHSDTAYDDYMADFEEILGLSQQLVDRRTAASEPRPMFSLEMGFMPFLYFTVLKCRRLDLRIRALQHILLVAYDQENLFSTRMLYAVGLRLVELEHGVQLDPTWPEYVDTCSKVAPMPADEIRVRSADVTEMKESRVDEAGEVAEYRKVYFLVRPETIMSGYMEWVKVRPFPTVRP